MLTTPPTPALADLDLDKLPRYGTGAIAMGGEFGPDLRGEYVKLDDVRTLARRAAQPVAPVQDVLTIPTAIMNRACKRTMSHEPAAPSPNNSPVGADRRE